MSEVAHDILLDQRLEIPHMVEELGQFTGLLREAINDADSGNVFGAAMVIDDALELGGEMEKRLSDMLAALAKWQGWVEEQKGGKP